MYLKRKGLAICGGNPPKIYLIENKPVNLFPAAKVMEKKGGK
jgi:hypothetical protein